MAVAKRQLAMANIFNFNINVIGTCKSYPYLGSLISKTGNLILILVNYVKVQVGQCTLSRVMQINFQVEMSQNY